MITKKLYDYLKLGYNPPVEIHLGPADYDNFEKIASILELYGEIYLIDHLGGVSSDGTNSLYDFIDNFAQQKNKKIKVYTFISFTKASISKYKNLEFVENSPVQWLGLVYDLHQCNTHIPKNIKNFVVSFNGTEHVSRQFLLSALHKFGWFNADYSTKNFILDRDTVDGNIIQESPTGKQNFYNKFFEYNDELFNKQIFSIDYRRYNHQKNFQVLEKRLAESFVHIVSETLATEQSGVSEKFVYSIISRGLFVIYGPYNIHNYVEEYLGFKKYSIFDYDFDNIINPIERLIKILEMLGKFQNLSFNDLHDLHEMEHETLEFNYDHFFSKGYINSFYDRCDRDLVNIGQNSA